MSKYKLPVALVFGDGRAPFRDLVLRTHPHQQSAGWCYVGFDTLAEVHAFMREYPLARTPNWQHPQWGAQAC